MKRKKDTGKLINTFLNPLSEYRETLDSVTKANEDLEGFKKLINIYPYSTELKEITLPAYKSACGDSKSMTSLEGFLGLNDAMFKTYLEKRTPSIKEDYILEIVKCFTKAFEEVYSNECPIELVNLCKEYVGNFVKSLDGSTKM